MEAGASNNQYGVNANPPYDLLMRTNYQRALLAVDTGIGQIDLSGYRNETRENGASPGLAAYQTNDVYDLQLSDTLKLGSANIVRGNVEYRDNDSESPDYFRGTFGYRDFAASLMWNWQLAPGLSVTNAVRIDRLSFDYTGTGLPAAGLNASRLECRLANRHQLQLRAGLGGDTGRHRAADRRPRAGIAQSRQCRSAISGCPRRVSGGHTENSRPRRSRVPRSAMTGPSRPSTRWSMAPFFAERNDDMAAGPRSDRRHRRQRAPWWSRQGISATVMKWAWNSG